MDNKQQEQLREEFLSKFSNYHTGYECGHRNRIKAGNADDVFNWFISKLQEQEKLMEEAIEEAYYKRIYVGEPHDYQEQQDLKELKSKFLKTQHGISPND